MKVDYLIQGGHVIDCYTGIDRIQDIAIADGVILSAMADYMDPVQTVDASGCYVVPGLIDSHTHIGALGSDLGVVPDAVFLPSGVTTAIDAGTSGAANYEAFRMMSDASSVRIKALLNVSSIGLTTTRFPEDIHAKHIDSFGIRRLMEQYADQLVGIKVRIDSTVTQDAEVCEGALRKAVELSDEIGRGYVAVHPTRTPMRQETVLSILRPGDVYAHVFQGKGNCVINEDGVMPFVEASRQKGVLFDTANGTSHFDYDLAELALHGGFLPDIISSDITVKNAYKYPLVFSLPYVMSKYLDLGIPLYDLIKMTTLNPAGLLKRERELGSLQEGTEADVMIFRVLEKEVVFGDSQGKRRQGKRLIKPEMTIRGGKVLFRQIDFF